MSALSVFTHKVLWAAVDLHDSWCFFFLSHADGIWTLQATAGLTADGRLLANTARNEAREYKSNYGSQIPPKVRAPRKWQIKRPYLDMGIIITGGTVALGLGVPLTLWLGRTQISRC